MLLLYYINIVIGSKIERITEMIKISHLVKNYGNFTAVDDISFEVAKGEVLGFLGPNGAGKSTTMNMLTGYLSSSGIFRGNQGAAG